MPIPDLVNYHAPIFMDGWNSNNGEYIALLAEAPFALESTWKLIWDQKVSFVVTILTSVSKVSRSGYIYSIVKSEKSANPWGFF